MRPFQIFFIVIGFIYLTGCDADKYVSSNLYSTSAKDSTYINGRVLSRFLYKPVQNATVQFGNYQATTDNDGRFNILMEVSQDDDRNLASPVFVRADYYIDYFDLEYILPIPQNFEYQIKSRIPILKKGAFVYNNLEGGTQKVIQALVLDFEGTSNIDSVYSFLTLSEKYDLSGNLLSPRKKVWIPLERILVEDDTVAFYQSDVFERTIDHPYNILAYPIVMVDNGGLRDTTTLFYYYLIPDQPIYPVDWGD